MPEYLSPGVYVEEIDTGAKPIEGVSTSTAGMVGLAERGPVNVPILVTGTGDYLRWFGGPLDRDDFGDDGLLPDAVEGFFRNGGRRLYVTRVAPLSAAQAALTLHDERAALKPRPNTLLRAAPVGAGLAANPVAGLDAKPLLALDAAGLAAGGTVRVGDGSQAEWHTIGGIAAATTAFALGFPLTRPFAKDEEVRQYAETSVGSTQKLEEAAARGTKQIRVHSTVDLTQNTHLNLKDHLVKLSLGGRSEAARVVARVAAGNDVYRLTLAQALQSDFPRDDTAVNVLDATPPATTTNSLTAGAAAGDVAILVAATGTGEIVEIGKDVAGREVRMLAAPGRLTLSQPAPAAWPAGSLVEPVKLVDGAVGTATTLTAAAPRGARVLELASRTGVEVGEALRVDSGPAEEHVLVVAVPGVRSDPGVVVVAHGLRADHAKDTQVQKQQPLLDGITKPAGFLLRDAALGDTELLTSERGTGATASYAAGDALRITTPDGTAYLHVIAPSGVATSDPQLVTLDTALERNQSVGATLALRAQLLRVEALDVGAWGNRLLVSCEEEADGLVTRADATGAVGTTGLKLSSLSGVEPGTVLELRAADGTLIGDRLKVARVDRGAGAVILEIPSGATVALGPAQLAAVSAPGAAVPVRSREFRLAIRLRRRDDPAVPSRGEQILDSEVFRYLSMDRRHSRYVVHVIGNRHGPPRRSDRRPEGESAYVRLEDLRTEADREAVNLGPEALTDRLPSGIVRAARHPLDGGDDGLATPLTPAVFIGQDDREPENRKGIPALKNVDDISLVAAPGQTDSQIQQALINHCEELRYRFAVLDGPPPPADSMADVQALRQRYDSKYAAIYHPWLLIPDAMPENLAAIQQVAIPPAGHVMGIYARTDIERGVHKAPANEVVRGITGLSRYLNKAEHDLLNPFPVNINVIRDFRADNRAIRVWGARVITSDPDFKYVNVRRLLIFLEKSIDRGLQWVVFEPNAEPLWARVKQTIRNFLTTVWRDGALEGTKPEEAFFVICDRTTMTQADIDNGRLIVVIGVAPVKPAEFVIIRIGLKTAQAED
jgi:phage tail sheath protein FI